MAGPKLHTLENCLKGSSQKKIIEFKNYLLRFMSPSPPSKNMRLTILGIQKVPLQLD